MANKGRTYELDMVRAINNTIDRDTVFTSLLDYSGVASDSDADILVTWPHGREDWRLALIELKKRSGESGKRFPTHPLSGSSDGQTGLDELRRLAHSGPNWSESWFALKPDHRALVILDAEWLLNYVTDGDEGRGDPYTTRPHDDVLSAFQPRLTPANHVSMRKPTLDEWPSSTAGRSDEIVLLEEMNVPSHYIEQ